MAGLWTKRKRFVQAACFFESVPHREQIKAQPGTANYEEYIAEYAGYISYDHYLYSGSVSGYYENLRTVAEACPKTDKALWIVLQAAP